MNAIPKGLSDKAMLAGFTEQETFETMFSDEPDKPVTKPKTKDKKSLSSEMLTPELADDIGRALLEVKLELYKEGIVDYKIKAVRNGTQVVLSAVPSKKKR